MKVKLIHNPDLCISKGKRIIEIEDESFCLNHAHTIKEKMGFVKKNFQLFYCTIRSPGGPSWIGQLFSYLEHKKIRLGSIRSEPIGWVNFLTV